MQVRAEPVHPPKNRLFGQLPDGREALLFTLCNPQGIEAHITNYGGIVTAPRAPDREGKMDDVVLGVDTLESYVATDQYFGALIGRFGNRIADGEFTLDEQNYSLDRNNGPHHLHGGREGFDKRLWEARPLATAEGPALELRYISPDGEAGYPGELNVVARYSLTQDHALRLDLTATTDKPTLVNLTQHTYFNLSGRADVLDHVLELRASRFTPVHASLIPTGEIRSVEGTPFDFRAPCEIGARLHEDDPQLKAAGGFDHNYVIDQSSGRECVVQARVTHPGSGRVLTVHSTSPGVQFYSGNMLHGELAGKGVRRYEACSGFCLEPQHFPDSPHHPHFPSTVLRPGATYCHTLIHQMGRVTAGTSWRA